MKTQGKNSPLCGPTALANAIELLGKRVTLKAAIEACGETVGGTDEFALCRGADALGFIGHPLGTHHSKKAWGAVRAMRAGILCVDRWDHWITVHGMGDRVLVFDPEERMPDVMTWRRLRRRWQLPAEDQARFRDWTYFWIELYKP